MNALNILQGSPEWHAWRLKGVGASEASAVLDLPSAWVSRRGLWKIKTGRTTERAPNFAMMRGNLLEPVARRLYEQQTGIAMPAALAVHASRPHLRASLDGWNTRSNRLLEIKVTGREDHELAKRHRVPEKHLPQLQQQLLVTSAECVDYFSYDGFTGHIVTVEPDVGFHRLLEEQVDEFWHCVETDTSP